MNIENKTTVLDDSAGIYQKREEEKSIKQNFSELQGKEKWFYYKDYYLKKTIVILVVIGLVVYFVVSIWNSQKHHNVLNVAVVDYGFPTDIVEQVEISFGEYIDKTSKYDDIRFDNSYYLNTADYSTLEKLQTLIMVGDLDVFIAPESVLRSYVSNGAITSLTEHLPTDLYSNLSDYFFYETIEPDNNENKSSLGVYGIYLDDTSLFKLFGSLDDRPVLGIISTSKNNTNAIEFIRFLFQSFEPNVALTQ